jgi:hypothetical protein
MDAKSKAPLFRAADGRHKKTDVLSLQPSSHARDDETAAPRCRLTELFSPHCFRVTVATDLLNQNVPLEDVQCLAGHSSPTRTRLYHRRRRTVTQNMWIEFRLDLWFKVPAFDSKLSLMDLSLAKSVIAVICQEAQRRNEVERDPDTAYEQSLADQAFVSELCLMFLVSLHHQLERQLINLAAHAGHGAADLTPDEYRKGLDRLKKGKGTRTDWKEVDRLLNINTRPSPIEALRLLANAYKHDSHAQPDEKLLTHLGLQTTTVMDGTRKQIHYAELPESDTLRGGLANCVGLDATARYITIAEHFIESVQSFLDDVKQHVTLSRVLWGPISLKPSDCAH